MNRNVTALILIVLGVGIYFTFTKGMLDGARAVKAVNDEYASAIETAGRLINVRDQVLKSYNEISQENRDNLDKMIPSTVDNIRLIIDLNGIAQKHGFTLKGIKAVAADSSKSSTSRSPVSVGAAQGQSGAYTELATPTLDTITVSFSVTAPYNEFISFMQDIEATLRIMDLKHLSMSSSDTGKYDFGVELQTYWLRQ